MTTNTSKLDQFRNQLAEYFIKAVDTYQCNWIKEWRAVDVPCNAVQGRPYKGINSFALSMISLVRGYKDNRFATFKQIKDNNWHLKKGAKGSLVEYWFPYDMDAKTVLTWQEYNSLPATANVLFRAKYFYVFNGDDIEGLPSNPSLSREAFQAEPLIDKIITNMGIEVVYGGNVASYSPSKDVIHIPLSKSFISSEAFNSTLLHELSHATGHKDRLDRNLSGNKSTEGYAFEELVAELTACFFRANIINVDFNTDIIHQYENNTAYLRGWYSRLKNEPHLFKEALKLANQAANYLEVLAGLRDPNAYQEDLIDEGFMTDGSTNRAELAKTQDTLDEQLKVIQALSQGIKYTGAIDRVTNEKTRFVLRKATPQR